MSDDVNECPDCGRRLSGSACACGWRASPSESITCGGCKREAEDQKRPKPTGYFCVNRCSRCGDHSPSVTAFHPDDPDTHPSDRGVRLCPSCWIPALRRRAEGTSRDARCPEAGCGKTVAEHIAEARAIASSPDWVARFSTARGEPDPDEEKLARLREQANELLRDEVQL